MHIRRVTNDHPRVSHLPESKGTLEGREEVSGAFNSGPNLLGGLKQEERDKSDTVSQALYNTIVSFSADSNHLGLSFRN
jgi:hypothetical protein